MGIPNGLFLVVGKDVLDKKGCVSNVAIRTEAKWTKAPEAHIVAPARRARPDTYIRPCNQIVGTLVERPDDGILNDGIRKVDAECVFN